MASVGAQIRRARLLRRMTIKQLAEAAGVNEKTLGRIERDEVVSRSTPRVLEYLGLDVNQEETHPPARSRTEEAAGQPVTPGKRLLEEATFPEVWWRAYELWREQVGASRLLPPPELQRRPDVINVRPPEGPPDRANGPDQPPPKQRQG